MILTENVKLYAWMSKEPSGYQIIAQITEFGAMPLVFTDKTKCEKLKRFVEDIVQGSKRQAILIELETNKCIDSIEPH